jgi:hypothetical protein
MNIRHGSTLVVGMLVATTAVAGPKVRSDLGGATIRGDYLEARTADVYTGPCFANGEVNLDGEEAVLAWKVREGSWQGVDVGGLAVVAAVKAKATLGDPFVSPNPARSVIVVDERATVEQKQTLVDFARTMGGDLLKDVIGIRIAPIEAKFGDKPGFARLEAGDVVELETRALNHDDHICGNEYVYYPPLTSVSNATPAYTLAHAYRGKEFNSTWSCPLKRSAFVAEFTR